MHIEKFSTSMHQVVPSITPVNVKKPGRPAKDKPPATVTRYQLSWKLVENKEGIEREQETAGCFVIITNVPDSGSGILDSAGVLRTYKGSILLKAILLFSKILWWSMICFSRLSLALMLLE